MNKIAWAVALVVSILLGWICWSGPAVGPLEDPWLMLRKQAELSQTLEEELEASKHVRLMLEQTEQAMIRDGLPLQKAAESLLHYGLGDYEDSLRYVHVRVHGQPMPEDDGTLLERVAEVLVRRARSAFHEFGNRAGYSPEFLQYLEDELRDLQNASRQAS